MRIMVHSESGDGFGIAWRLQQEGHDVRWFVRNEKCRDIGKNLLHEVRDFLAESDDCDLVVFDSVGQGSLADLMRNDGHLVFGASYFQDQLEFDRPYAMQVAKAAGMKIPETWSFRAGDFTGAIKFCEAEEGRYVFKASGNVSCDKTYIAHDAEDMIEYLEHLDRTIDEEEGRRPPFILQSFVHGVEVSTERVYAMGRPIEALTNSTFEQKKFLAGDLGPATGSEGSLVIPHRDRRLLARTVGCFDALARTHALSTFFDVNAIVGEDRQCYFLEVTARFGYNAIQTFVANWLMPLGETLEALAEGRTPPASYRDRVSVGLTVSVPPYPGADAHESRGTPVIDDILDDRSYWPADVLWDETEDDLVIAGAYGIAYVRTNVGADGPRAWRGLYKKQEESRLPDRQWRNDLERLGQNRWDELQALGYLRDESAVAA